MTAPRPSRAPQDAQAPPSASGVGSAREGASTDDTAPCLFCDRAASEVIGESANWYIRLDTFPANPGHVEVVTKRHVESLFGLDGDESGELYGVLAYARNLVEAKYGTPDGWTIGVNDGRAAGRSIDHMHVHLIPRHDGDVTDPRGGIRQCAPNSDPDAWGAALTPERVTAHAVRLAAAATKGGRAIDVPVVLEDEESDHA